MPSDDLTEEQLRRLDWMTDKQWRCYQMLARVCKGYHHIYGPVRSYRHGIRVSVPDQWSTWDSDKLTRLVVLAHEWCVRAEIQASSPGRIAIALWARNRDSDAWHETHPTLKEAAEKLTVSI